jgi:4-hydroxy-tetrahydrodipicolinate synthase
MTTHKVLILGAWRASDSVGTFEVKNPADGKTLPGAYPISGWADCGATGAITGLGNALPREVLRLVDLCKQAQAGDVQARWRAQELEQALLVLSTFDEGPDLVLFYKYLLVLNGEEQYRLHFNPSDSLSASQQAFVEEQ